MEQYAEAKTFAKNPMIKLELKLDFSQYVPKGFETSECVITRNLCR
ncbi:DUF2800 domain-containing protein [Ligilactobacillus ruminis]